MERTNIYIYIPGTGCSPGNGFDFGLKGII